MSTSRILESKSAQLERSLHNKRVTLSTAHAELRRTEQSLSHRRGEFYKEVKKAVVRVSRKQVEVHTQSEVSANQSGTHGGFTGNSRGPRKPSYYPPNALPAGEFFNPLPSLAKLKSELVATEQRLNHQKVGVQRAAIEVSKTEEQLSAVQSMVGKLKIAAKIRLENTTQEEILSQAITQHALSRQIFGQHSPVSKRGALHSSDLDEGITNTARILDDGEKNMGVIAQVAQSILPDIPSPHSCIGKEPMHIGVSTAHVDNTPSLAVECHSRSGDRIDVTVSGNAHESVKVELAVSDSALLPVLLREKGAILRKLKEAGHAIGDVHVVTGRGSSSSKASIDPSAYRRRRGGDDELAIS